MGSKYLPCHNTNCPWFRSIARFGSINYFAVNDLCHCGQILLFLHTFICMWGHIYRSLTPSPSLLYSILAPHLQHQNQGQKPSGTESTIAIDERNNSMYCVIMKRVLFSSNFPLPVSLSLSLSRLGVQQQSTTRWIYRYLMYVLENKSHSTRYYGVSRVTHRHPSIHHQLTKARELCYILCTFLCRDHRLLVSFQSRRRPEIIITRALVRIHKGIHNNLIIIFPSLLCHDSPERRCDGD